MSEKAYQHSDSILFTPGPVMVSEKTKYALVHPDIGHRENEFSELLIDVRHKLAHIYGANEDYATIILTGSGTAANEAVISSCIRKRGKVLIISNGEFGERLSEIAKIHGINEKKIIYEWGEYPNIDDVETILKRYPEIDAVLMVHHETSTGMLNPILEIGQLTDEFAKTFIVDAVSALGGEELNVLKSHIDFCTSSSNKCIESLPGLSFVCAKREKIIQIGNIKQKTFYLDLYKYFKYEDGLNQSPHTPAVPLFFSLNTALDELLKEGIENRIKRYKENAKILREGIQNLGLRFQIPQEYMSNTITNAVLPRNIKFDEIHNKLKEKSFIVYHGKGPLEDKIFQVSNMGHLTKENIFMFLDALEKTLSLECE